MDWLRGVSEVGKKGLFDPLMIPLATNLIDLLPRKIPFRKRAISLYLHNWSWQKPLVWSEK